MPQEKKWWAERTGGMEREAVSRKKILRAEWRGDDSGQATIRCFSRTGQRQEDIFVQNPHTNRTFPDAVGRGIRFRSCHYGIDPEREFLTQSESYPTKGKISPGPDNFGHFPTVIEVPPQKAPQIVSNRLKTRQRV